MIASVIIGQQAAAMENITIRKQDGANIAAQLYGSGARGVVLAHGGRFTKEDWAPQAEFLAATVSAFWRSTSADSVSHQRRLHPNIATMMRALMS
jgi:hypothetical protein